MEIIFPSLCEKIMFLFPTKTHYVPIGGDDNKRWQILCDVHLAHLHSVESTRHIDLPSFYFIFLQHYRKSAHSQSTENSWIYFGYV